MQLFKPKWISHGGKPIFAVDIHPDGTRFATGGLGDDAGVLNIWNMKPLRDAKFEKDPSIPKSLAQMDDHTGCVNCLRWSNNGQYLASGGDDKMVLIWQMTRNSSSSSSVFGTGGAVYNYENWKNRYVLRGHTGDILDIAWSPDDSLLATGSIDNSIIIWDAKNFPESHYIIKGHVGLVKGVVFDPVGKYLASQSDDKTLCVWNVSDWSLEKKIKEPFKCASGTTHALRLDWSPDGQCIASAHAMNNGGPVSKIIERKGWKTNKDFAGHRKAITVVKFCSSILQKTDGSKTQYVACAVGSRDRSLSIWLTSLKRPLVVIHNLFEDSIMDISWTSCGQYVIACSLDGTVACCQFTPKEIGKALPLDEKYIYHKKTYGTSIKASKSLILSSLIENPDLINIQNQNQSNTPDTIKKLKASTPAKTTLLSPKNVKSTPDSKLNSFSSSSTEKLDAKEILLKQKETKTKEGRKRIVPIMLEPPTEFEDNFVNASKPQETTVNKTADFLVTKALADSAAKSAFEAKLTSQQTPTNGATSSSTLAIQQTDQTSKKPLVVGLPSTNSTTKPPSLNSTSNSGASTTTTTLQGSVKRKADAIETTPKKSSKKKKKDQSSKQASKSDTTQNQNIKDTEPTEDAVCGVSSHLCLPYPDATNKLSIQVKVTLLNKDVTSLIEVENDLSPKGGVNTIRCLTNDDVRWETCLSKPIMALAADQKSVCAACQDCTLHVFSMNGSRILPGLKLDGPTSYLQCCQDYVMVITSSGLLSIWNIKLKKVHINKEPITVILKEGTTIENVNVNNKGQPIITTNDRSSHMFDQNLSTWVELSNPKNNVRCGADMSSCVAGALPKGPLHLLQSPLNKLSSSMLRGLQANSAKQHSTNIAYLEEQLCTSLALESAEEYHFWFLNYVRCIVQNDEETRLRELCEDLIGTSACNESSRNKKKHNRILVFDKRDLLKDILPIIATNLRLQRLHSEMQQLLDAK